jgi:hypothetical protein
MIVSIIIIVLLLGAAGYLGYRVWFLAGALGDAQEYIEQLESTNSFMFERIEKSYNVMKQIDRLGAFEAEDEAGTTFDLLKQVINELKEEFNNGQSEEE